MTGENLDSRGYLSYPKFGYHTCFLALERFPTTDEITKLFIFATSLTARVEKTVIVLLFYGFMQGFYVC